MTLSNEREGEKDDLSGILGAAYIAAGDIALITDGEQKIVFASDTFAAMTGYHTPEILGLNCRFLQGPGTDLLTVQRIRETLASGEPFEGEILNYRKDGSAFWTELKIVPMNVGATAGPSHYVSVQRDISNRVALFKHLQDQAFYDPVTGLPNRAAAERAVEKVVERALRQGMTVAVGLIDLDDFRIVNNTLGHAAGDSVLQQWATRVLSRMRQSDMLARMGGDEFLLILEDVRRDAAHNDLSRILDRLHEAIEEPFTVDGQQVSIGMSLGIALIPEDGTNSRTILRNADEALYLTKHQRKHGPTWWQTAESNLPAGERVPDTISNTPGNTSVQDCRRAIADGNILIHLQPVVDLRNGTVHLFEALARLELHGERVVFPDEFLPGLDAADQQLLFAGILTRALEVIAGWDREGIHHDVSVNLPPTALQDSATLPLIKKLLHANRLTPDRLGLELLESEHINLEAQRLALKELAELGVGLGMDDLGSGYSSLQRLSSFPFNAIKIDRGLFLHVHERPLETLGIMATLIQMGRDLGINVVIEGLEDESLTEAATILGAPFGQGYFLAKPMPPEECLAWSESFELETHRTPIRTPLGALAYHWQFTRLAAPHPLEPLMCPLTRFISELGAPAEAESWHAMQHTSRGIHLASSRLLTDWLTQNIRSSPAHHETTAAI